jgi:DNA-binding transcriptional LysR family regulator
MMRKLREEEQSRISLALINGFSNLLPKDFFYNFLNANPDAYFDIVTLDEDNPAEQIIEQSIGLGFIVPTWEEEEFEILGTRRRKLYLITAKNHRLAQKRSVYIKDLRGEVLISFNHNRYFSDMMSRLDVTHSIFISQAELPLAYELCRAGRAVFLGHIPRDLQEGLAATPISDLPENYNMYFVRNKAVTLNTGEERFVHYVKNSGWDKT